MIPATVPFDRSQLATLAMATAAALSIAPAMAAHVDRPTAAAVSKTPTSDAATSPVPADAAAVPRLDVSEKIIRAAAADARDPTGGGPRSTRSVFGGSGAFGQAKIDQAFRDAEIPSCLSTDAFRFEQPRLGPITLAGVSAPMQDYGVHRGFVFDLRMLVLTHAVVSGACRH